MPILETDIQFLKDLQHELNTQETDGQAAPRFWTIADYRMVPCRNGDEEEYHVTLPQREYHEGLDELLSEIKESFEQSTEYDDAAQELFHDISDEIDAEEWLRKYYDEDAEIVPVKEEFFIRDNTMFLTKAEAKEHLQLNDYHYTQKAHTYAMTAWRAPKVEQLLTVLETIDWDAIPVDALRTDDVSQQTITNTNCRKKEKQ